MPRSQLTIQITEVEGCALEHALSEFENKPDGTPIHLSAVHRRNVQAVLEALRLRLEEPA